MNDDRYIDGIFNYCDRWCERCPMTSRCRLFATEQRSPLDAGARELTNAAFWDELERKLRETTEMLIAEAKARGIVFDEEELARTRGMLEERWAEVEQQPAVLLAHATMEKARDWLGTNESRLAVAADRDDRLADAV